MARGDVIACFVLGCDRISFQCYQPNGRIVDTFFAAVFIALYGALRRLAAARLPSWHLLITSSHEDCLGER
jgi:hypothetical protein